MPKRRIFFDGTPLVNKNISGVGKVLLETLHVFDMASYQKKYKIYVFIPINEVGKLDKYGFKNIDVKLVPYPHKFLSLFSRMRLSPPIDIFFGKGVYVFENYRNWNLLFSKSITYIHDIAFRVHPEFVEAANLKYLNSHINMWIGRTDKIVTVSESSKREIEEQFGVDEVGMVMNASDSHMYPRSNKEIETARGKWNIPENYFLYFGNIEPRKNLINMVKAFTRYVQETKSNDTLVLIGGDGWKNEEIYAEIEKARSVGVNIIKPKAYVPDEDMPALLSGAVALLQVSWHEGFGMSVLHALACGTPVVASDIPALHEAARGNDRNVAYVDPGSVDSIAKGIADVRLLSHVKNPEHITSWSESIKSLESIIDNL